MTRLIFVIGGLLLFLAYPWIILFVGLYLFWILLDMNKKDKTTENLAEDTPTSPDPNPIEKNFKPGFRDNPEWQKLSARIRKVANDNKKANDIKLKAENIQDKALYWAKKR